MAYSMSYIQHKLHAREMVTLPKKMVAAVDVDSPFIMGVIFL